VELSLPRPRRLALLCALLAAVAVVSVGCEVSVGDKTIDAASVEEQIARNVESQGDVGVESVDCPGGQAAKQGGTFECIVTLDDGSERTAEVELVDDEGTFRYQLAPAGGEEGGGDAGDDTGGGQDGGDGNDDTGADEPADTGADGGDTGGDGGGDGGGDEPVDDGGAGTEGGE
jgi:hypothetical protein